MAALSEKVRSVGQSIYNNKVGYSLALLIPSAAGAYIGKSVGETLNRTLTMAWCMASAHFCPNYTEEGSVDLSLDKRFMAMSIMGATLLALYAASKSHALLKSSLPQEQAARPIAPMRKLNAGLATINDHAVPRYGYMLLTASAFALLGAALFTTMQQSYIASWCESTETHCPDYDMDGNVDIWAQEKFKMMLILGTVLGLAYGAYKGYMQLEAASNAHEAELQRSHGATAPQRSESTTTVPDLEAGLLPATTAAANDEDNAGLGARLLRK